MATPEDDTTKPQNDLDTRKNAEHTADGVQADTAPVRHAAEAENSAVETDFKTEPARAVFEKKAASTGGGRWYGWLGRHKKWTAVAAAMAVVVLAGLGFAFRYSLAGVVVKRDYAVTVMDAQTKQPVSAAAVTLGGATATTDSKGRARLRVPVGQHTLVVHKKYYAATMAAVLVPFHQNTAWIMAVKATGRQVPIVIQNRITGKPLAGVTVSAAGTEAKTDLSGHATIVLPADKKTLPVTAHADGYNKLSATVQVTGQTVAANTFSLTPAGSLYFLSNQSGTLDVVKSNLDGSNRTVVLKGTGFENRASTVLLASSDWKYVALSSVRSSSGQQELNLIDGQHGDKVVNIDKGDANFTPIGWSGSYFMYVVGRNNVPSWQPNGSSIKSYHAPDGKLTTLDSSDAHGTSDYDAEYQSLFSYDLLGGRLVYAKTWYRAPGYLSVPDQQDALLSIAPDGSAKKTIATLDAAQKYFGSILKAAPGSLEIVVSALDNSPQQYYKLASDGSYSPDNSFNFDGYLSELPSYLLSPSDKKVFWSEQRDGKNTLLVADADGGNQKQIAALSDYRAFGWFNDDYIIVSKNNSELYIMPATGGQALDIGGYYTYYRENGYANGYGGM